jgi:hypothetical protein
MQYQELDETDTEAFEADALEFGTEQETGSPFSEVEELELAAELLGVSGEAELESLFGKLKQKTCKTLRRYLSSPVARTILITLKRVIKHCGLGVALKQLALSAPLSREPAAAPGQALGLELEGLSPEDQELEVAKQLVRFAGAAISNATKSSPSAPPAEVAREALVKAAQRFAPGLARVVAGGPSAKADCACHRAASGQWERHGHAIILHGL